MKLLLHLGILACLVCITGCKPEERFWWSPQGDRAAVLQDGEVRLVSDDGELSPPLAALSEGETEVKSVSWLPDGSGFVCHRERSLKSWDEVRPLIGNDELQEIERWMPAVPPMLEGFVALSKDAESFVQIIGQMPQESREAFGVAAQRLFQQQPEMIAKVLAPLPKSAEMLDVLRKDARFTLDEITLVRLEGSKIAGVTALRTFGPLRRILFPRVSPKHMVLSLFAFREGREDVALNVMSLQNGELFEVSANAVSSEWAKDGRHLVFGSPLSGNGGDNEMTTIFTREVIQESGLLMKPTHEKQPDGTLKEMEGADRLPEASFIATTVAAGYPTIATLPEGRVLFAGLPVTFPMANVEIKPSPLLYLATADGRSITAVPTQPGDLPAELGYFTVSPDGERAAIVESGTDAVAVLTLETGRVQIISPAHPNRSCRTMPAWKSATELTFAAWSEEDKSTRWMLWSQADGLRVLSGSWPAGHTHGWTSESKPSDSR